MSAPAAELGQQPLPALPQTLDALAGLLAHGNTRTPALQDVILRDPGAAVELFRLLHRVSPRAAGEVRDIAHAVSMVGFDAYRRHVGEQPRLPERPRRAAAHDLPWFQYSQAAHAACYATAFGGSGHNPGSTGPGDTELGTAALLQNPAVLALCRDDPDAAQRAVRATADGMLHATAFSVELGEPLPQANQRVADAWGLPALSRKAMVAKADDPDRRSRRVQLFAELARVTAYDWRGEECRTSIERCAAEWQCEPAALEHDLHQSAVQAARVLHGLGYPLAAFDAVLLPSPPVSNPAPNQPAPVQAARSKTAAGDADTPPPSSQQVLSGVLKQMHRQPGIDRAAFLMLDRRRSTLSTRLILGGDAGDLLRGLKVGCAERHLFSLLIGKSQSLWLNSDNEAKYRPLLTKPLARALAGDGFYAMSLFVDGKPLGICYADGPALSEAGYRRFRELCQHAVKALERRHRAA